MLFDQVRWERRQPSDPDLGHGILEICLRSLCDQQNACDQLVLRVGMIIESIAKTRDTLNDRLTNFMSEIHPNDSFYV